MNKMKNTLLILTLSFEKVQITSAKTFKAQIFYSFTLSWVFTIPALHNFVKIGLWAHIDD
jgi:hypothetical protein